MNLRIIRGPANRETEKAFEAKWKELDDAGYRINEKLTTTHVIGSEIVYSIVIEPKPKIGSKSNGNGTSDQMKNRLKKIENPTQLEQNLMTCFGTRSINPSDREKIEASGLTLDDALLINLYYKNQKHLTRTEKNSRGMKTTFSIFVNNLQGQLEIANEWHARRGPRSTVIDEPSWNWRSVRDEIAKRDGEIVVTRDWDSLSNQQKKEIMRLKS